MLKCPVCGYETPKDIIAPKIISKFRRNRNGNL
jgi:hypothetical protein